MDGDRWLRVVRQRVNGFRPDLEPAGRELHKAIMASRQGGYREEQAALYAGKLALARVSPR
jgi:hypothetical protein